MTRRPPKPKINLPNLKWLWRENKGAWEPNYLTTWTEDGKRKYKQVKLDWEGDEEKLFKLYWECRQGKHEKQAKTMPYTWKEAIIAWRKDPFVQKNLAASTKASYRPPMDLLMEKNGAKDMRHTTRSKLRKSLEVFADTPRKAARIAQTISLLWNYAARELDWPLGPNPASGLAGRYKPAREFKPWPAWMIDKLPDAPQNVQTAAMLILGTGQRPSAAFAMQHSDFHDEWMQVFDEKGDRRFEVYCPPKLRNYLATLRRKGKFVLAKNLTEPLGYDAIERSFRTWRKSLGENAKPFSLHGLRKLAIIELAEAGCGDAEIQSVTGQSSQMVAYYRKEANRKALSKSAQERRT